MNRRSAAHREGDPLITLTISPSITQPSLTSITQLTKIVPVGIIIRNLREAPANKREAIDLLISHTIPGAEFDSSERYPPPSCHPGTRLDISGRIISWMRNPPRTHKVVWLHGPAGVGKSAVLQTLAESEADSQTSILGATIFFSRPAERDDPQQVFITIAYQLAVKYQPYRAYIVQLLTLDPKLVRKSLVEQFKQLVVKPFAEQKLLEGETTLITLDGLDECKGEAEQRKIIFLINKFSLQHPNTPLVWIIASRPEPHISSAFSHQDNQASFLEIDMPIDSDQACSDVEHFLRDRFAEIRENYFMSFSTAQQWPTETQFVKVAIRASGLFVFADTVVRFVEDAQYSNPVAQLQKVINFLDSCLAPTTQENPLVALDTLYTQILSETPFKVLPITRKLLTALRFTHPFAIICNILGIGQAEAYSALRRLHSVLKIPPPERAHSECIEVIHASFADYLDSPARSCSFWIDLSGAERLWVTLGTRILSEAHNIVESVVHTSSINISWNFWGAEAVQKEVFFGALIRVLSALPGQLEYFHKLSNFFQDIDYANLGALCPDPSAVIQGLSGFFEPRLLAHLRESGIFAAIPIQSLDLSLIDPNGIAYIVSDRRDPLPIQEGLEWDQGPPRYWVGALFGFHASASNDWCFKAVSLGNEPGWTGHISRYLTIMMDLAPFHTVNLLGKGSKTCALITFDILDRLWLYVLPYKQT